MHCSENIAITVISSDMRQVLEAKNMRAVLWWNPNTQIFRGNKPIFAFLLLYTCTCTKQGEQYFIERTF